MKNFTFIICLFICSLGSAQEKICRKTILDSKDIFEKNEINKYEKYDFSNLWLQTESDAIFGVIGNEYQRILIKFISIKKDSKKKNEYIVQGKSQVKSNTCDFFGRIIIAKIQEVKNPKFGVDDEYKNSGIKSQGSLMANYLFFEDKEQKSAGKFEGTLQSIWYLNKNDAMVYNNIGIDSDSYFNNAFIGTWKSNKSDKAKLCNWGDYRVPNVNCDFDMGSGELSVSEKYLNNGWRVKSKQNWWK